MAQPSAVTAGCKLSPRGAPTRPRSASSVRRAPYLLYATATAAMTKPTAALNARPNKIIHTPRSSGHKRERPPFLFRPQLFLLISWSWETKARLFFEVLLGDTLKFTYTFLRCNRR